MKFILCQEGGRGHTTTIKSQSVWRTHTSHRIAITDHDIHFLSGGGRGNTTIKSQSVWRTEEPHTSYRIAITDHEIHSLSGGGRGRTTTIKSQSVRKTDTSHRIAITSHEIHSLSGRGPRPHNNHQEPVSAENPHIT
jgi:hypothetical protein